MGQRVFCEQNHPGGDAEADRWCEDHHRPRMPFDEPVALDSHLIPAMRSQMADVIEDIVASLDPPTGWDDPAAERINTNIRKVTLHSGVPVTEFPQVRIEMASGRDGGLIWSLSYANGLTFRRFCQDPTEDPDVGCMEDATEMVTPYSLCARHAETERADRARHRAAMDAYSRTPEARREAAAEQAFEARYS